MALSLYKHPLETCSTVKERNTRFSKPADSLKEGLEGPNTDMPQDGS